MPAGDNSNRFIPHKQKPSKRMAPLAELKNLKSRRNGLFEQHEQEIQAVEHERELKVNAIDNNFDKRRTTMRDAHRSRIEDLAAQIAQVESKLEDTEKDKARGQNIPEVTKNLLDTYGNLHLDSEGNLFALRCYYRGCGANTTLEAFNDAALIYPTMNVSRLRNHLEETHCQKSVSDEEVIAKCKGDVISEEEQRLISRGKRSKVDKRLKKNAGMNASIIIDEQEENVYKTTINGRHSSMDATRSKGSSRSKKTGGPVGRRRESVDGSSTPRSSVSAKGGDMASARPAKKRKYHATVEDAEDSGE